MKKKNNKKGKKGELPKVEKEFLSGAHPEFRESYEAVIKNKEIKAIGKTPVTIIDELQKCRDNIRDKTEAFPKGSFIHLDDYIDRKAVSYTYGFYPRTKPVLNIAWIKDSEMDDDGLIQSLMGPLARLSSEITDIYWGACILPHRENYGSIIIRLMAFAISREQLLELIDQDKEEIPSFYDVEMIQYNILQFLGQKIGAYLEEDGIPTSVPRRISEKEGFDIKKILEGKQIGIDLQYAGKDLVEFGYIDYIKERSESPMEGRLATALVLHGFPSLQNLEIYDPDYKELLTKADLIIMNDSIPLLIYVDGAQYHSSSFAQTHDKRIDRRLQELGFQVIRVSGSDVFSNIERIVEDIKGRIFGRGAHILPEEIWKPKINAALKMAKSTSDKQFLGSIMKQIELGKRITVKQEAYLNKVCNRLGLSRAYDWLSDLENYIGLKTKTE